MRKALCLKSMEYSFGKSLEELQAEAAEIGLYRHNIKWTFGNGPNKYDYSVAILGARGLTTV